MPAIKIDITGDNDNIVQVIEETTKKFEEMSDYMKQLGDNGLDLSNTEKTVEELGGAYEDLINLLKQYGDELAEVQKKQQDAMMAGDTDAVKKYGEDMKVIGDNIQNVKDHASNLESILSTSEKGKSIIENMAQGFQQAAPEVDKASGSFGKLIKTVLPGIAKFSSLAGVALVIKKVASDAISMTQRVGDTWNREVSGWKNSYEAFVRSIGSGKGFTEMIEDMKRAYEVGKKFYDLMDELFELQNSLTLAESKYSSVIADSRVTMMDTSKSFKERKDAAQDLIDAEKKLGEMRQRVADQRRDAALLQLEDRTKMSEEERTFFIEEYQQNEDLIHQAEAYGQALKDRETYQKLADNALKNNTSGSKQAWEMAIANQESYNEKVRKSNELIDGTSDAVKNAYEILLKYNEANDNVVLDWVEAEAAARNVTAEVSRSTMRAETTKNRMELEEKKANQAYVEALRNNKLRNKKEITNNALELKQAEIDAMKEGNDKVLAQIDLDYEKEKQSIVDWYDNLREEKIKKAKELFNANPANQGKVFGFNANDARWNPTAAEQALYAQKLAAADARYGRTRGNAERSLDDTKNEYLQKYGEYWERRLAIQKEYQDKIDASNDEWERKRLEAERQNELRHVEDARLAYYQSYGTYAEKMAAITEDYKNRMADEKDEYKKLALYKDMEKELKALEKEYSSVYSLIFADASSLSNNLLAEAIRATQEEIQNATESGDIEALTELYEKLREQMNVQTERNRGWGFFGISSGFEMLRSAKWKRLLAGTYEGLGDDGTGIDWAKLGKDLMDDALNDEQQAVKAIQNAADEVGDSFSELGSMLEGFEGVLGDIGKTLSAIGSNASTIGKAFSGSMTTPEAYSAAISGTIQLLGMVFTSIQQNKKAEEEWNLTIEKTAMKYKMLQLAALDYKQQNIFGVENPYKKAIDGAYQYAESMKAVNEQVAALQAGQVQTGTKKVVDWGNVGKGAAIGAGAGAAVGSIIPGIGTAIGAAIGAAIGLITGALSTKVVPVFENLQEHYGELFNPDTYELNQQLLADYDKLDEATKQIVDNWEEIIAKAKEAEEQMRQNFSDLAGDIGNQLSEALVNAFRNGNLYSAIDDFHKKMTSTIEDILSQLVFSATFGAMFDELEERMMDSFRAGGDQDITDDLVWMEEEYQNSLDQYNNAMEQVKQALESLGYNVFSGGEQQQNAKAGAFQTMSQDTAGELNGRFTAFQLSNEIISKAAQDGLGYIITIADVASSNNAVLSDIRNMHALELGYLEDITKYTKTMLAFGDKLDKIEENTSKL